MSTPDDDWVEPAAPTFADVTGYTEDGEPTFDHVRDKVEQRMANAIGGEEVAHLDPKVAEADDAYAKRQEAAKKKLDEIRKSMGSD